MQRDSFLLINSLHLDRYVVMQNFEKTDLFLNLLLYLQCKEGLGFDENQDKQWRLYHEFGVGFVDDNSLVIGERGDD